MVHTSEWSERRHLIHTSEWSGRRHYGTHVGMVRTSSFDTHIMFVGTDVCVPVVFVFKDYHKNIVFRDCQMHFPNIHFRRKEILCIIFCHFVELPAKNQPLLDYF